MNIVNFFVLDTNLVAGCENGLLIFWELKKSIDEAFVDLDGLKPELKRSEWILKFSPSLKGLHSLGEKIIGFDTTSIFLTDIAAIPNAKLQNDLIKHVSTFSLSEVRITTLSVIDEKIMLFGTENNKLCLYDLARKKIKKQVNVYNKMKKPTNHCLFFTEAQKKVQIIDIVLTGNKKSAFVALSNSHIYQVSVETLEIVKELRSYAEQLESLMLNEKEDLIWCIYEHSIIGESLSEKTKTQIFRIQASNTIGVAKIDEERYFVAGRHPQINWIFNYSENYMMALTTRYTTSFKFIVIGANRYLLIGGSDGVIDVFWKNSHHLVLFPSLDSVID